MDEIFPSAEMAKLALMVRLRSDSGFIEVIHVDYLAKAWAGTSLRVKAEDMGYKCARTLVTLF